MSSKSVGLSWGPLIDGERYCSPACGRGCTKAEYERAVKAAQALVKKLGYGWVPNVWENLGWYYKATSLCGRLEVSPLMSRNPDAGLKHYYATLGERWTAQDSSPRKAVTKVIAMARKDVKKYVALLEGL